MSYRRRGCTQLDGPPVLLISFPLYSPSPPHSLQHFLDEADVLGDRVIIMADGKVRCCGTPAFLKSCPTLGVGYSLTIWIAAAAAAAAGGTTPLPRLHEAASTDTPLQPAATATEQLIALVRSHVPAASVLPCSGREVSMRLPMEAAAAFPALLSELDALSLPPPVGTGAAELSRGAGTQAGTGVSMMPVGGRDDMRPHSVDRSLYVEAYSLGVTSLESCFLRIAEESAFATAAAAEARAKASASVAVVNSAAAVLDNPHIAAVSTAVVPFTADAGSATVPPPHPAALTAEISSSKQATFSPPSASSLPFGAAATLPFAPTGASFSRHVHALLIKRARMVARDAKSLCFQLFIPVFILLGGLLLLKLAIPTNAPDYTLSTLQVRVF